MRQVIKPFYEDESQTWSYVLADSEAGEAAVIDPVMRFDPVSGRLDAAVLDAILTYLDDAGLALTWILETHAHADHMSGAPYLQARSKARTGIGRGITSVQAHFRKVFNLEDLEPDGRQFDALFDDGDTLGVGGIQVSVMATPGHTSDSVTYLAGDAAFVGDTLFMPDVGTARCDFPGGDAATLYRSIRRIFSLPDATQLYLCHDYPHNGRAPACCSTVAAQKADNIHVGQGRSESDFVAMRQARDATLDAPRLILPSLQVNIRAGRMPPPESNGTVYLKIPLRSA